MSAPLSARLSSAIDYTKDGSAHRGWQPVRGRDGSAIVELGSDTDPLVVAWTTYGEDSQPMLMSVAGELTPRSRSDVAASLHVDGLHGSYRGPATDPANLRPVDPIGADALDSHGPGEGGNVLLKNGEVRASRERDGLWKLSAERLAP